MTSARVFRAPGRVNLIGDHTDYNEGFVLPLAIDLECVVTATPRRDAVVRLHSADVGEDEARAEVPADGSVEASELPLGWSRYAAAVIGELAARGRPPVGVDMCVSSTIPLGAGLASSAALEVGLALALCDAAEFVLPPLELALACQAAERRAIGVPCGIMDQLTSIAGRRGCALLIDCRDLSIEPIAMPDDVSVVVVHSGMRRDLVNSEYAERRYACESIAERLGLRALRDASLGQVQDEPFARHVVSENARVVEAAQALADDDSTTLGRLLGASHASLRDDFEVSTPELDALVYALEGAGALGARLTGAGFGGCVVALANRAQARSIVEVAMTRYRSKTGLEPSAFVCRAVDGAGPRTSEGR